MDEVMVLDGIELVPEGGAVEEPPEKVGSGPYYEAEGLAIWHADCREVLPNVGLADAVVTDPPYGYKFMGKNWDHGVPGVEFWRLVLAAMKPGAYLLAFGGTRTFHRLACAIEDAGFEQRDMLMWVYGSGFPKSLDVSKSIDKAAGAEREVGGHAVYGDGHVQQSSESIGYGGSDPAVDRRTITAPATDAARQWEGWGTALKPAWEPIILARKPLGERTVAANVLKHGVGGLNISATRIGTEKRHNKPVGAHVNAMMPYDGKKGPGTDVQGRWPANLLLECTCDGPPHLPICPAGMLDEQAKGQVHGAGHARSGAAQSRPALRGQVQNAPPRTTGMMHRYGDTGGASRFFYCAKSSRKERGEGNNHATVKPLALMRWLVRLVTPPGGTVLDPFMGSGSTLLAARAEGMQGVGIELEAESCQTAQRRIEEMEDSP